MTLIWYSLFGPEEGDFGLQLPYHHKMGRSKSSLRRGVTAKPAESFVGLGENHQEGAPDDVIRNCDSYGNKTAN